jgi:hypothetical protein
MLVDANRNAVVASSLESGYGLTLDDVEAWLARWGGSPISAAMPTDAARGV